LKPTKTYLSGKSVFTVSLFVIVVIVLTVYFTGTDYNRSITANTYLSLGIIGSSLFFFMTYGLYTGVGLRDDFPEFKNFEPRDLGGHGPDINIPSIEVGDGIEGLILSVLLWIAMTILALVLLFLFEAVLWFSVFILLAVLYWLFFRALKFVFSKSKDTKGDLGISAVYALGYTMLYIGWIFGIVYFYEFFSNGTL
jgi:hypothetical protein